MIEIASTGVTEALVRNNARIARLSNLEPELMAGTEAIYAATESWYDSQGDGSWPKLAPSTIASKVSQGYSDPERPLYAEGNLRESATSPNGPRSFRMLVGLQGVVIGVDWDRGGWQIPVVLSRGTDNAGRDHNVRIPPRPIWPGHDSLEYGAMRAKITLLMMRGI